MLKTKLIDALYVGLLMLYVIAGITTVPFHGDESLILYMTRDWYYFTHDTRYLYQDIDHDYARQDLRILNGPLSVYMMGASWTIAGFSMSNLNDQYDWCCDMTYNREHGKMPSDVLLFAARVPSVFSTAISVALVFAIGKLLAGRRAAWLAALVFTLTPAVVLNGRRAVFEGPFMVTSLFLLFMGLLLAKHIKSKKVHWLDWLLLGIAAGLALCAKHSALLFIAPIFGGLFLLGWRYFDRLWRVLLLAGAGLIAGGVFFALNPAWWAIPLQMPQIVAERRESLLQFQVENLGGYTNRIDGAVGMVNALFGPPQYFESTGDWQNWLKGEINTYEGAGLAGSWGLDVAVFKVILILAGLMWALRWIAKPHVALFVALTLFLVVALYWATPLPWPRYYLPLAAPLALLSGLSLEWLPKQAFSTHRTNLTSRASLARLTSLPTWYSLAPARDEDLPSDEAVLGSP